MQTESLVTFNETHFTDHKGRTHDGIHAEITQTDLTEADMIGWIMDLLKGCSILRPREVLIVDFHRVHHISVSFWTQFLQLRRQIRMRGGHLRVYRLNKDSKTMLSALLSHGKSAADSRLARVGA